MQIEQTVDPHQQYPWITTIPERFVCATYEISPEAILAYAWLKVLNPGCVLYRCSPAEIESMDAKEHPTYAIWVGNPKSTNLSAFRDLESYLNYIGRFGIPDKLHDEVALDIMRDTITKMLSPESHGTMMEEVLTASLFLEQDDGNFEVYRENPFAGEFNYRGDEAFLRCAEIPIKCMQTLMKCYSRFVEVDAIVYDAVRERDDNIVVLPRPVIITNHHYDLAQDEHKDWFINPPRPPQEGFRVSPIIPHGELAPRYAKYLSRKDLLDLIEADDGVTRADPHFQWFHCKGADEAIAFVQSINARMRETH